MEGVTKMPTIDLQKTQQAWSNLTKIIFIPHTEEEYQRLVEMLDDLIDEVGEDEDHPLASLMEIIGVLIEQYETENISEKFSDGEEVM
jgi:HTH-type transcriptional regulator/antitoxin HigA